MTLGKMVKSTEKYEQKLRVINIGIETFYDALLIQSVKAVQVDWHPPVKQSEDMAELLDDFL